MSVNLPVWKRSTNDESHMFNNELENIFSEFSRDFTNLLFPKFFSNQGKNDKFFLPRIDVSETNSDYYLEVELPGIEANEIEVKIKNGVLIITGEKKLTKEKQNRGYSRKESLEGSFYKAMSLPNNISEDAIEANFKNGVLEIKLPKDESSASKAKTIKIK